MELELVDGLTKILEASVTRAQRAVLFVDVVESVRLIETDEVEFLSRWLKLVDHTQTQILPEVGGRLVKGLGDGLLLDFDNVLSAVAAAFKIQDAADTVNRDLPISSQIQLRTGIDLSDVILDKN